jgi:hypothetical protein
VVEEVGEGAPLRGKAQRYGAGRNTRRIRIGASRFMPQPGQGNSCITVLPYLYNAAWKVHDWPQRSIEE